MFFSVWNLTNRMQDRFNIYGVYKPSEDSGIDEPPANLFEILFLIAHSIQWVRRDIF